MKTKKRSVEIEDDEEPVRKKKKRPVVTDDDDEDWEKELAEQAASENAREKASGGYKGLQRLSARNKRFHLGEENLGKELTCIVVDYVYLRTFWGDQKYDEDDKQSPVCFALDDGDDLPEGNPADGMVPHKNSPELQARKCAACPQNEWGSGGKNRKACQTRRRLALLHIDDASSGADVADAEIVMLELPTTTVRNWAGYVKDISDGLHRPVRAVVTKITFDTSVDYTKLDFELVEKASKEITLAVKERLEEIREKLMTPYSGGVKANDDEDDDEEEEKPVKKKTKKKAAKKPEPEEDEDDEEDDAEGDADDDENDEEEFEDDEEVDEDDERPARRSRKAARRSGRSRDKVVDRNKRRGKGTSGDDDADESEEDDEDDEDKEPARKKSRFRR